MTISSDVVREAAAILRNNSDGSPEPKMMYLCADALEDMADILTADNNGLSFSHAFLSEAEALIHTVRACAGAVFSAASGPAILFDHCFALFECLTVIAREQSLRQPSRQASGARAEICRYFESCGHWKPEDGTLVCNYYYSLLPSAMRVA